MAKKSNTSEPAQSSSFDFKGITDIKTALGSLSKGSDLTKVGTMAELHEFLMPKGYVSTGDDIADLIISNRPNGGLPLGKYINVFGDTQSGKSLLCWKFVASIQRAGGYALYFDTENAAYPPFVSVLGVDTERVIGVFQMRSIEKIFLFIIQTLLSRKKNNDKRPLIIVIDSMKAANLDSKLEDLEDFSAKGYDATQRQKVIGDALEKTLDYIKDENVLFVTVDQVRDNLNAANKYSPKHVDTAGNAQKFYSDLRIQLTTRAQIKLDDEIIGAEVELKTVKNRIAPSNRKTTLFVYYTRGLDRWASWIESGKKLGIFQTAGAYIKIKGDDGEDIRIDGKLPTQKDIRRFLEKDAEFRNKVYKLFCEKLIVLYEQTDSDGFADLSEMVTTEEVKDPTTIEIVEPKFGKRPLSDDDDFN